MSTLILFMTQFILLSFIGITYAVPTMIVIWGQPTGSSTPESTSYSTWNSCLTACMAAESCVLAASKTNVESDGCYIYLYGKITTVQKAAIGTTKVAFKLNLDDSTCPPENSNPPLFGKSTAYVAFLDDDAAAAASLKLQRSNAYTITEPTTGNWVFTYGGCLESELSFSRYGGNYCIHKFDTLVSNYSTAEEACESNSGFLHTTLNITEFNSMKSYIGNSAIDYWVDGSSNCGGKSCKKGVYYSNRLNETTYGVPNPNHCYYIGTCDPCLQYDIAGYLDTNCTNVPAGYICIFPL